MARSVTRVALLIGLLVMATSTPVAAAPGNASELPSVGLDQAAKAAGDIVESFVPKPVREFIPFLGLTGLIGEVSP